MHISAVWSGVLQYISCEWNMSSCYVHFYGLLHLELPVTHIMGCEFQNLKLPILSMHKDLYVSLLTQLLLCTVQLFFEKITRVINPQDVCVFWSKSFYGILSFVVSPTVHRASNSLLPRHDKWHVTMHSFWFFYISFTAQWGSILGCPLYSDLHVSFVIFFRFLLSKLGLYSYIKMFSVWVDLFLL